MSCEDCRLRSRSGFDLKGISGELRCGLNQSQTVDGLLKADYVNEETL